MVKVPGIGSVTPFVVSVMLTPEYVTDASARVWPGGRVKLPGPGGSMVSEPMTLPFLPELKVPDLLTGAVMVVLPLSWALAEMKCGLTPRAGEAAMTTQGSIRGSARA